MDLNEGTRKPTRRNQPKLSVVPGPTPDRDRVSAPERIQYRGIFIPLENISVLPQGRRTFEHIDELAEDIADKGLISPPLLTRFDTESAKEYLREINKLWHRRIKIDSLTKVVEEDGEHYYVLIAGERRYRAIKALDAHACHECAKTHGPGGCFSRHFPTGLEARICDNISPLDALWRQASENIHNSLLPHEEAIFYDNMFRVAQMKDPNFTLAEFSRKVGRGEDKVRDALRFCMLPQIIQDQVRKKQIPYGIAVEIARIAEAKIPQGDLDHYIKLAAAGNMTVGQFSRLTNRYLEIHNSGNLGLFSEGSLETGNVKQVVNREATRAFWVSVFYIEKIAGLFNDGLLGKEDSPFSSQGPIHALKAYVKSVSHLLPHLVDLLPDKEIENIRSQWNAHRIVIEALDKSYPNPEGETDELMLRLPYEN